MKSMHLAVASFLVVLPLSANAAELKIKPGLWETTMTRTNPLTGEPTTETFTKCSKVESFNPSSMMQDAQGCELVKDELNGDTLSFRMECLMEQGAKSTVDGQFQSDGTSGTGKMDVMVNMGEMNMTMKMDWTSKHIGDC